MWKEITQVCQKIVPKDQIYGRIDEFYRGNRNQSSNTKGGPENKWLESWPTKSFEVKKYHP